MRRYRRTQPSLGLFVVDAFAAIKLREPSLHFLAEGRVLVERGLQEIGQDSVRLAVRLGCKLRYAALKLRGKMQRHGAISFNDSVKLSHTDP